MKKLSLDQFIQKASLIHNNRYGYQNTIYTNYDTKVDIECNIHGIFQQTPDDHLSGKGCNDCGQLCRTLKQTKTQEQFIKDAKTVHGNKYNYNSVVYKNCHEKVDILCNIHKCFFKQAPSVHLRGGGCSQCGLITMALKRTKTRDQFIKDAKSIHGDKYKYLASNYKNMSTKVDIECNLHGIFQQTPDGHLSGNGCKICGRISMASKQTKTRDQFIKDAKSIHGNKYNYDNVDYKDDRTKIAIKCKDHGIFQQTPGGHLSGKGCNDCGQLRRTLTQTKTREQFIKDAKSIHGNKYNYNSVIYKNNMTKVTIWCTIHNYYFKQKPGNHLNKNGCPLCIHKTEAILYEFLKQLYPLQREVTFDWCINPVTNKNYRFDFYIALLNLLIELDGPQHTRQVHNWSSPEQTQKSDRFKIIQALKNGRSLIRISQEDVWNDRNDWKTKLLSAIDCVANQSLGDLQLVYLK